MPDQTTSINGSSPHGVQPASMQALGQEFRSASDAKLRKVTQLIDRMPQRGAADALLEPVRDRLAALRPVRHMNRTRLLFTPFDRVLVPAGRWQPGSFTLPRSMLAPVIALLETPNGAVLPTVPPFDADDPAELLRCGRKLWDAAAAALAGAKVPADWVADWAAAGWALPRAVFEELLPVIAMMFRGAYALQTLPSQHGAALEPVLLRLLADAARCGPVGWGIMLTLLLDTAVADQAARLAGTLGRGERMATLLRAGLDHAMGALLDQMEGTARPPAGAIVDAPEVLLQRLATMQRLAGLRCLENRPGFEQKRIDRLEQTMASANRDLFRQSLSGNLDRFEAVLSNPAPDDGGNERLLAIEADARRLRLFAVGAAALDGGREYEGVIEDATARVAGNASGPGPGMVSRLRLVELLAGSERAIQMASTIAATNRARS